MKTIIVILLALASQLGHAQPYVAAAAGPHHVDGAVSGNFIHGAAGYTWRRTSGEASYTASNAGLSNQHAVGLHVNQGLADISGAMLIARAGAYRTNGTAGGKDAAGNFISATWTETTPSIGAGLEWGTQLRGRVLFEKVMSRGHYPGATQLILGGAYSF